MIDIDLIVKSKIKESEVAKILNDWKVNNPSVFLEILQVKINEVGVKISTSASWFSIVTAIIATLIAFLATIDSEKVKIIRQTDNFTVIGVLVILLIIIIFQGIYLFNLRKKYKRLVNIRQQFLIRELYRD